MAVELGEITRTMYPFEVIIQPHRTSLADVITYYKHPETYVGRRCNDVNRILMIDSDGEAIPVHGRCFRFPIANVRDHSLSHIWNHEKLSHLRKTLRQAGGSVSATLPKDMADRLHLEPGDRVLAVETDRGILLTPYDPEAERALKVAARAAKKYRSALRELAK